MCQLINNFCTFKLLLTHVHTHLSQCVSMPSCIRAYSDVFFLGMLLKTSHASTANLVAGDPPPPSHTHTYMHWPGTLYDCHDGTD